MTDRRWYRWCRVTGIVALTAIVVACGARQTTPPPGSLQPDRFLSERGEESLQMENWLDARIYFQQLIDGYPQSPFRPDAKLGLGDAHLGENTEESLLLAEREYREFLMFYPTHARADYAQYKIAMTHFEQMRAPERDQTPTTAALAEFEVFFGDFPDSPLSAEVRGNWRIARDRLSEAWFAIGFHYFRTQWYPGAIDRFREVLREDPGYAGRDEVYFYLAESLARTDQNAEAIPYLERLLAEFDGSDHLEDARIRLEELKNQ